MDSIVASPARVGSANVILVLGVNGSGKTTTVGKLALRSLDDGRRVLLAAADTFRAAAIEQLQAWGRRTGVDVIAHQAGADPSAVAGHSLAPHRHGRPPAHEAEPAPPLRPGSFTPPWA